MKYLIIIVLFFILLCNSGCDDSITTLSATKDGEELNEGEYIPFELSQNYPNPTNGSTTIRFTLATAMYISLKVYTEDWTEVVSLVNDNKYSGYYSITFSGRNKSGDKLPSGDYYYCLEGNGYKLTRAMRIIN